MAEPAPGSDHGAAEASGIVVVIPTLDEEESIADVVRSLPRAIVSRVIVAEGGRRAAPTRNARAVLRLEHRNANASGASGTAHSGNSGRLPTATRRQFQSGGKPYWHDSGRRTHHRDLRPRFERDKSVAARARSPARAFERAVTKSASSTHRHNVICLVC